MSSILKLPFVSVLPLVVVFMCMALFSQAAEERASIDSETSGRFFETRVRPVLVKHCHQCHGPTKQQSSLRLDSIESILKGGDSGPSIEPSRPEESLLVSAINHSDALQMPPKYKLGQEEIDALTAWVRMGAPWPGAPRTSRQPSVAPGQSVGRVNSIASIDNTSWCFTTPTKPEVPSVRNESWPCSDVDRFVLAKLEERGLEAAAAADKRTLIRRATYDLHGLPPTPEEIHAFLGDSSPRAFERLVERLLQSPRYGERWGRHWLDVARYADSNGADENRVLAHAWRYRDYVIECLNQDVPFDRFVTEQLAGDLLPANDEEDRNRLWIATGFLAIGPKPLLANDTAKVEMDVVDEQIETIGRVFLGLSLGCARCHDHKFDPISAEDYYALAGIFKSTKVIDAYDLRICRIWSERALGSEEDERRHLELKAKAAWCDDMRRLSDGNAEQKKFIDQMRATQAELAKIPVAIAARESGTIANVRLHLRGSPQTLGREIPRGFPKVFSRVNGEKSLPAVQSGRLELARWLTEPAHPLTARVMANRIWKWHMGEGLVRSPNDFGAMGQMPDNQPLLDYLAVRFVESGWSIKAMHRLIMLSAAYQMSSQTDPRSMAIDPENRLLGRMHRRRLDAEEIRDSLWSLGGVLDFERGGPALPPSTNHEQVTKIQKVLDQAYSSRRRAVYLPVVRSGLYELFQTFDFADPSLPNGRRDSTTVAPQSLFLMNSNLIWEASQVAAARLSNACRDQSAQVRRLYEQAYGRLASDEEIQQALDFLEQVSQERNSQTANSHIANLQASPHETTSEPKDAALQALIRAIVMTNEFLYVN